MTLTIIRTLLGLLLLLSYSAHAAIYERLDDSASPRANIEAVLVLSESGKLLSESFDAKQAIIKFGRVDYRLSTTAYLGKKVRIYYVIPNAIPGLVSKTGVTVEWQARKEFTAGSAHAGERQLVWSGMIQEPWLEESFDLQWTVQLDQIRLGDNQAFGFEAYFEIEVLP